jgi:predicted amidohydrolase YtcJ
VLDRNLFQIPPEDLSDTKVLTAFFEGRVIFERAE